MLTHFRKNGPFRWPGFIPLLVILLSFSSFPTLSFSQIHFQDMAISQNIVHNYGSTVPSGGVSFCDFNGDGWDDLTLATALGQRIAIYLNDKGTFRQINSFFPDESFQGQVLWVDYDNDGDKDFFMASLNSVNRLYRNDGDFNMVDVTAQAGLTMEPFLTYGACFGDYDRDGWLDLYLGKRTGTPSDNTHLLYKNLADGTFVEVGLAAGAQDPAKIPFCSAFFDYNNDLWPDLYTANDRFSGNTLLRNNKDGSFANISVTSGTGIHMNAMSVTVGDYNKNGRSDIYVTNTEGGNVLLQNEGGDRFIERAATAGVGFYSIGWGALFLDADNDGWQDLYVSGSRPGSEITSSAFYYNLQDGSFSQPDVGFVMDTVASYSNALGDFNRDGKPDIMVINGTPYTSHLWSNQTETDHHWISVQLEGVLSNRDAIGSSIQVYAGDQVVRHFTQCGTGFLGQNAERILFGLGNESTVDSIIIQWPTGHVDRLYQLSSKEEVYVVEGSTTGGEIQIAPEVQLVSNNRSKPLRHDPIRIFPNPAGEELFLTLEKEWSASILSIRLIHPAGQVGTLPSIKGIGTHPLDISHLPSGMYWIQVKVEEGAIWQQKFIKL